MNGMKKTKNFQFHLTTYIAIVILLGLSVKKNCNIYEFRILNANTFHSEKFMALDGQWLFMNLVS